MSVCTYDNPNTGIREYGKVIYQYQLEILRLAHELYKKDVGKKWKDGQITGDEKAMSKNTIKASKYLMGEFGKIRAGALHGLVALLDSSDEDQRKRCGKKATRAYRKNTSCVETSVHDEILDACLTATGEEL